MKKKLFIVGAGPLPNEKEGIREAAGLRTEQFIRPLQKAGHEITLILITNKTPKEKQGTSEGIAFTRVHRHDRHLMSTVKNLAQSTKPDLCIGINTFPAFVLSKSLPKNCPFWADLNGWIMAEAQARSWSEDSNDIFANAWRQEKSILKTADKISTVSENQKFAIIGELAATGILRKENFLEEKVISIPNATKFFDIDTCQAQMTNENLKERQSKEREIIKEENTETTKHVEIDNDNIDKTTDKNSCIQNLFRGVKTPKDAFIISWIGGYNNWVDEQTLFDSVSKAMSTNDNIYFVSTGGAIKNIADDTFGRFRRMIDNCQYTDRFIFLGWIETEDMRTIYEESDIGINADYKCIETETGARNRLNEMMKFGLPIVTTGGSEIAEVIGGKGAGITVPNGDVTALTDSILKMAKVSEVERANNVGNSHGCSLREYGKKGQYLSEEVYTDEETIAPLLNYSQNPVKTALPALPIDSPFMFAKNIWWYITKNNWNTVWGKVWQKLS